ncbi:hypothetical protein Vretifemale_12425, partial [Volvox reticuliferus]
MSSRYSTLMSATRSPTAAHSNLSCSMATCGMNSTTRALRRCTIRDRGHVSVSLRHINMTNINSARSFALPSGRRCGHIYVNGGWGLGIESVVRRRDPHGEFTRLVSSARSCSHLGAKFSTASLVRPLPAGNSFSGVVRHRIGLGGCGVALTALPTGQRRTCRAGYSSSGFAGGTRRRLPPGVIAAAAVATDAEAEQPYLGPAADLLSAMDALSYTRTFTEMCIFLEKNYQYFRGAEVAAVVLQAANVSELATQRQVAAAMSVAERRSAELAGRGDGGRLNAEMLAGAVEEVLSAAGPGSGGTNGDTNDDTVLDELDAADQLMAWATPLLRAHIKRYPPDAVSALLASLAQLQQYDRRLMEIVAENFKSDPQDWLRRASSAAVDGGNPVYEGPYSSTNSLAADPWFSLVSLAGAYARLGHYDRDLMSEISKLAVKMMPMVSERADAEDVAAAADAAATATKGSGKGGFRVTDTVVALVSSFFEVYHLDPPLLQAAGEHLASFSHQLDQGALSEVILAFAGFNARNSPFYSLMLRRLLEAAEAASAMATAQGAVQGDSMSGDLDRSGGGGGGVEARGPALSPRAAGTLYRACILLSDMGDVPELTPLLPPPHGSSSSSSSSYNTAEASASAATAAVAADPSAAEARYVGRQLSSLLRECLAAYPLSSLHATPLGRPTPQQLEQASVVPELLEAWEITGLLTVPQIISTLQQLPGVEPLPPSSLATSTAGQNGNGNSGGGDDDNEDEDAVVGGADAVAWVPPDALLLYDPYGSGSRSSSVPRIAIKALDEKIHCCRNIGPDPDLEPDRPGPRSGSSMNTRTESWSPSSSTGGRTTPRQQGHHRMFRLRGPAVSELRCLEVWGWKVLMVPVGIWGAMDPAGRRTWLLRKFDEIAAEAEADAADGAGLGGHDSGQPQRLGP